MLLARGWLGGVLIDKSKEISPRTFQRMEQAFELSHLELFLIRKCLSEAPSFGVPKFHRR